MRVHVLHHARCFDGAASAAIFAAFYRQRLSADARLHYFAKQHRQGDPYDPKDFDADETAVVDFRYTTADSLVWYFDHHQSAFQLAGERDHFDADPSGRKFHDPHAPSCTGFIAKVTREHFGFDATPHEELLHWAEIIDSASFATPEIPVRLEEPALRLMTFAEQNRRSELVEPFIEDLIRTPIAKLAQARYVVDVLDPLLVRHEEDIELFRQRLHVSGDAMGYELLDQPPRAYNKFIPYYHFPRVGYLVGLSVGPDGSIKLSAGYNPWLPTSARRFDISTLCERHGGGGHPYVGGVTFGPDQQQEARRVQAWMLSVFRGETPP
jgi:hypothetical protein